MPDNEQGQKLGSESQSSKPGLDKPILQTLGRVVNTNFVSGLLGVLIGAFISTWESNAVLDRQFEERQAERRLELYRELYEIVNEIGTVSEELRFHQMHSTYKVTDLILRYGPDAEIVAKYSVAADSQRFPLNIELDMLYTRLKGVGTLVGRLYGGRVDTAITAAIASFNSDTLLYGLVDMALAAELVLRRQEGQSMVSAFNEELSERSNANLDIVRPVFTQHIDLLLTAMQEEVGEVLPRRSDPGPLLHAKPVEPSRVKVTPPSI